MRILVCGDSFAITDPDYPELHWSEKILNHSADIELCNLAAGGASNAMIAMQLLQGLQLKPDAVIFSFTTEGRYELDHNTTAIPKAITAAELADFQKQRWITNSFINVVDKTRLDAIDRWRTLAASESFEWLKDYFLIAFCLQTAQINKLKFAYSLGGFEYRRDWHQNLRQNFIENIIADYNDNEISINLWYHQSLNNAPLFHVVSNEAQTLFANHCLQKLDNYI